jgi:hypothetical protein
MSTARDPPPASTQETGLQKAKTNLTYLALGSGAAVAPSSLATRSFLTTTRYVPPASVITFVLVLASTPSGRRRWLHDDESDREIDPLETEKEEKH